MDVSELALKLIVVLLPGIIAVLIFKKLTHHKNWDSLLHITNAIVFSVLSYLALQVLITFLNVFRCNKIPDLKIWKNLSQKEIDFNESLFVTLIGIVMGYIGSWFENKRIVNKIAWKLGISNKYGDEVLFYYLLGEESGMPEVYVKDFESKITYHGFVKSFSEDEKQKEIVLENVIVYDYDTSEELYRVETLYLSKSSKNIVIEIPKINPDA